MTLLKVTNLTKNFGGLTAVSNVSLEIEYGELIGLIGPNGAGKTTFFNLLSGIYVPSEGTVELDNDGELTRIDGKRPDAISGLGLGRTFQNIRLFPDRTVLENVLVAMNRKEGPSVWHAFLRTKTYYESEHSMRQAAMELLEIFDMGSLANEQAKNLAYGQQRHLEIVRALATNPKILFLDEPAAGMNPNETAELTRIIAQIRERFNLSIVLIEHDMSLVMDICERIYVLEYGSLIAQGSPKEIQNDPDVIRAYLGGDL